MSFLRALLSSLTIICLLSSGLITVFSTKSLGAPISLMPLASLTRLGKINTIELLILPSFSISLSVKVLFDSATSASKKSIFILFFTSSCLLPP
jgi:hypothetical protein